MDRRDFGLFPVICDDPIDGCLPDLVAIAFIILHGTDFLEGAGYAHSMFVERYDRVLILVRRWLAALIEAFGIGGPSCWA